MLTKTSAFLPALRFQQAFTWMSAAGVPPGAVTNSRNNQALPQDSYLAQHPHILRAKATGV